jgi:hypothetical protein
MTYDLAFLDEALKEWRRLDNATREQFKAKLAERLEDPEVPSARLHGAKERRISHCLSGQGSATAGSHRRGRQTRAERVLQGCGASHGLVKRVTAPFLPRGKL